MVLLAEQVRLLASESSLIDDATAYAYTTSGWGTVKNYGNITLASAALVVFSFQVSAGYGGVRLKIGSYYVFAYRFGGSISGTYTGVAYVAAGTHAVIAEGYYNGATVTVSNFKLGQAQFLDKAGSALAAYSSTINLTVSSRTTPIGALKNAVFIVRCYAITSSGQTNFENVGDSLTNGVSLAVDGAQVNWTERYQDTGTNNGASAMYACSLSVGTSHSFAISKDNGSTAVHISIYASPWLLFGTVNQPVTLGFPQGSTLYLMLEPLNLNPTKTVGVGKKRAVSFGDATDYYSTGSGTGLLSFSCTLDVVSVSDVNLYLAGLGGCVGYIGVDTR
ncbi:MAG: hypothetical protein NWE95_00720 [Candidatus Bathyarchaeota archaeon]|nr:hypothetical protein [Candidatus Bathyarchaeota archaeon]